MEGASSSIELLLLPWKLAYVQMRWKYMDVFFFLGNYCGILLMEASVEYFQIYWSKWKLQYKWNFLLIR